MAKNESPQEVQRWFHQQVSQLWPVAAGSLSLRRSPCIRKHCSACESGEQHASYVLYGRRNGRRFALYIPDAIAEDVRRGLANGQALEALLMEAGWRYVQAVKNERRRKA